MLYFTLPDRVGWDTRIGAIDHYKQRDTEMDTQVETERERKRQTYVLFGMNQRESFLFPVPVFMHWESRTIGSNKKDAVKEGESIRRC